MLEASFLVLRAAYALGEEASLASHTQCPRPSTAGLLLAEAQLLGVAGQDCMLGTPPTIMTSFSRAQVSSKRFTFSSTLKSRL